MCHEKSVIWISLAVQHLRLCASSTRGWGFDPWVRELRPRLLCGAAK